jgi:hypothetical protein
VGNGDGEAQPIAELLLKLVLPSATGGRFAAAGVGQNQQVLGVWVAPTSFPTPPTADGGDGESGGLRAGAPPVVVLSFQFAQRRFTEISGALGQSILINNAPFTVAGVAAPEFFGVDPAGPQDLYVPIHAGLLIQPLPPGNNPNRMYVDNNFYWVQMMGRLRPGVARDQAQTALVPVFRHFVEATAVTGKERADLPALYLQDGAGGLDFLRRQYSKPLYVLMTMVALILAIACANIANLLLARAAARRRGGAKWPCGSASAPAACA